MRAYSLLGIEQDALTKRGQGEEDGVDRQWRANGVDGLP